MVTVALAAGDSDRARAAAAELDQMLANRAPSAVAAAALGARAELRGHDGDIAGAIADLRQAITAWHRVGSPLHVARTRLQLAELFVADRDASAAELELSAARNYLAEIGADRLLGEVDRIAELIAGLPARP
jgi:hypothetical protein